MEIAINKWGNSLGLRIPKYLIEKYNLKNGSKLIISESKDGIVLKKPKKKKITLEEIVKSIEENGNHEDMFPYIYPSEMWEYEPSEDSDS